MKLFTIFIFLASFIFAEIPKTLSYQGYLLNKDNSRMEGQKNVSFRIYNQENNGTIIWEENQTVLFYNGIYSTILGEKTPINIGWNSPYWITLKVENDKELMPRQKLTGVAYSLHSIKLTERINDLENRFENNKTIITNQIITLKTDLNNKIHIIGQNIDGNRSKFNINIDNNISYLKNRLEKNISIEINSTKKVLNKKIDTKMTSSNWDIDNNHQIDSKFLEYNRTNIFNSIKTQIPSYNSYSLAWGGYTIAWGIFSTAFGYRTIADQNYQLAIGTYNKKDMKQALFSIGNGNDDNNRSDIFRVSNSEVKINGNLFVNKIDIENNITILDKNLQEIDLKVIEHIKNISTLKKIVSVNEKNISKLSDKLSKSETNISNLEKDFSETQKDIFTLQTKTSSSENNLTNISYTVLKNKNDILDLKTTVSTRNQKIYIRNNTVQIKSDTIKITGNLLLNGKDLSNLQTNVNTGLNNINTFTNDVEKNSGLIKTAETNFNDLETDFNKHKGESSDFDSRISENKKTINSLSSDIAKQNFNSRVLSIYLNSCTK